MLYSHAQWILSLAGDTRWKSLCADFLLLLEHVDTHDGRLDVAWMAYTYVYMTSDMLHILRLAYDVRSVLQVRGRGHGGG